MLMLMGCACREKSKVAQASRDLAAKITRESETQDSKANSDGQIGESRIYLDATISMSGFANQGSTYDELLDELGDAMPGAQIYKYGQQGEAKPKEISALFTRTGFGLEIHKPQFYGLTYNPDDRLIDFLAAESRPVRSVLITDGVYSEPQGSTAPPVVEAIHQWMKKGGTFGILIFRSAFKGPFYSERARAMQPTVTVKDRPFYAFIFSPTEQGFKELEEKLQRRFKGKMQPLLFGDKAVQTSIALPDNLKSSYAQKHPPEVDYYWQMFSRDLFAQSNRAPVGFVVKVNQLSDYPAAELKVDIVTEYYRWEKGQFKKIESGPPPGFEQQYVASQPNPKTESTPAPKDGKQQKAQEPPNLTVYLPKDSGSNYSFYHLKLIPSVKELRPEILQLSTRDDRNVSQANRTFRFFELITALTDIHFKDFGARSASSAIFITVNND